MGLIQPIASVIDITHWRGEEESRIFPVGAREKKLVYCPPDASFDFLESGHRYLFKLSVKKCPEQFWIEIFAYYLGVKIGINVPQALVAYDKKANQYGALIRWFLEESVSPTSEVILTEKYISGGDLLQGYIPDFDLKKGLQHNFETIVEIFEDNYKETQWKQYWAKTFLFDALIGNIDRHQDNWGIIEGLDGTTRLTPVFDNGTSMGYEIKADRFHIYDAEERLKFYILRGKHHMKLRLKDTKGMQHGEFIKKYIIQYPETRSTILDCLRRVDFESFEEILGALTKFDISTKLTSERAGFMLKLLKFRYNSLMYLLG